MLVYKSYDHNVKEIRSIWHTSNEKTAVRVFQFNSLEKSLNNISNQLAVMFMDSIYFSLLLLWISRWTDTQTTQQFQRRFCVCQSINRKTCKIIVYLIVYLCFRRPFNAIFGQQFNRKMCRNLSWWLIRCLIKCSRNCNVVLNKIAEIKMKMPLTGHGLGRFAVYSCNQIALFLQKVRKILFAIPWPM